MNSTRMRCCRSEPRCKACPIKLHTELRELRALRGRGAGLPAHLAGLPRCLHKYAPLFERQLEAELPRQEQRGQPAA